MSFAAAVAKAARSSLYKHFLSKRHSLGSRRRKDFALRSSVDFDAVLRSTRPQKCGGLRVWRALGDGDRPQLGMMVSRKVGNAIRRNRIRRQIRELFHRHRDRLQPGERLIIQVLIRRDETLPRFAILEDWFLRAARLTPSKTPPSP